MGSGFTRPGTSSTSYRTCNVTPTNKDAAGVDSFPREDCTRFPIRWCNLTLSYRQFMVRVDFARLLVISPLLKQQQTERRFIATQ